VQGEVTTLPEPSEAIATVPPGSEAVPTPAVSVTVAVQVVVSATTTLAGAQTIAVLVERVVTVMAKPLELLEPVCLSSLGL
jgi:hypothetical protein